MYISSVKFTNLRWQYRFLAVFAGLSLGGGAGLGIITFHYAKGTSYLTNDPKACANCHIMEEQYSGWLKSSHHAVATCNDCHTPPGTIAKYLTKASNGFWHSFAFTTGRFHEPIQIKARNADVTERACRKCHQTFVHEIDTGKGGDRVSCTHCHLSVGHAH